jgi:uncharacterized protein YbcI
MDADGNSPTQERQDSPTGQLSTEMVRIYKTLFGRGPTKASTHWAGPNLVVCTLEDSLTPAERSLVEMGEDQRLRETRLFFQYATEDDFRGTVEKVIGRKVRAFISGIDAEQDVSAELFYFEPEDQD